MIYQAFYKFFAECGSTTRTAITRDLIKRCTKKEVKTVLNQATNEWFDRRKKKNTRHLLIPNSNLLAPYKSSLLSTAQRDIVSFDVEKVESMSVDHRGKHSMLAAWVSVVGESRGVYQEIYTKKVKQTDVDWNKPQWSGITYQMVKDGITPGQLKGDLLRLFQDKILVTKFGKNDLISSGFTLAEIFNLMEMINCDQRELNDIFYRKDGSPLGLHGLVDFFYHKKIHTSNFHDPKIDAEYQLRLYVEQVMTGKAGDGPFDFIKTNVELNKRMKKKKKVRTESRFSLTLRTY